MKLLKKITLSIMVITLIFSTLGTSMVGAQSNGSQKKALEDQLGMEISDEEFELSSLIAKYTEFDLGENKVIITNKRELAHELKNFDGVNLGYVVNSLNSANSYLASVVENESEFGIMSVCSTALGIIGLVHGTNLSVAAGILGVAWWIAVPIIAATGAIWVAGSIACP